MKEIINIPKDFTPYTGLRYKRLTPGVSGEEFRDQLLIPALEKNEKVIIILDGNIGEYVPSFLEECFGGLIRKRKLKYDEFKQKVEIVSKDAPQLIEDINHYVRKEASK